MDTEQLRKLLIDAAENDHEKARRLLKKHPSILNAKDTILGETALDFLAVENFSRGVRFLIESGANVNTRDKFGATPLAHAVQLGNSQVAQLLLDAGADPNACDETGETPLRHAAREGNTELFEALLRHGADPSYRTEIGESALDAAPQDRRAEFEGLVQRFVQAV